MLNEEEHGYVEGHGEKGGWEGWSAEAVEMRILVLVLVCVILVGNCVSEEGIVCKEEAGVAAFDAAGGGGIVACLAHAVS